MDKDIILYTLKTITTFIFILCVVVLVALLGNFLMDIFPQLEVWFSRALG